jgi:hypothetical protein
MRLSQSVDLRQRLKDQRGYAVAGDGMFLIAERIQGIHTIVQQHAHRPAVARARAGVAGNHGNDKATGRN